MKSLDQNLLRFCLEGTMSSYTTIGSYPYNGMRVNGDGDFTFSGFGSNDPKKRKAYTAGSFTKTEGDRVAYTDPGIRNVRLTEYYQTYSPVGWKFFNGNVFEGIVDVSGGYYCNVPLNPWIIDANLSTIIYNNSLTKLYDSLRNSDLNLLLTVGERKESAKMLTKAFKALGSVIRTARNVRRQVLTNPSLLISQQWLGAKYGWLPFYNDVYNCTKFHFELFEEMEAKGRAQRKVEQTYKTSNDFYPVIYHRKTHSERCLVIVAVGIANSDAYNLSRITSLNPLSLSWELMPFSFVVDWFVDIGGFLANMEASFASGLSFKRGMKTTTTMYTHHVSGPANNRVYNTGGGSSLRRNTRQFGELKGFRSIKSKARTILTGFPRPTFPVFQVNVGSQRMMSGAALLRTILLSDVKGKH